MKWHLVALAVAALLARTVATNALAADTGWTVNLAGY
jgi:hypothetical protein